VTSSSCSSARDDVALDLDSGRHPRSRRRGVSGLGLLLVLVGLLGVAIAYSAIPPALFRLWPLILVAVGVFGLLRRPGWVQELDLHAGPELTRSIDRPRRLFSWLLLLLGLVCLLFSLGLVSAQALGPGLLVTLGLVLLWRRAR